MNKLLNIESFPTLTHMEQHIHFILAASKKKEKGKRTNTMPAGVLRKLGSIECCLKRYWTFVDL